jgi:hypothetical protein
MNLEQLLCDLDGLIALQLHSLNVFVAGGGGVDARQRPMRDRQPSYHLQSQHANSVCTRAPGWMEDSTPISTAAQVAEQHNQDWASIVLTSHFQNRQAPLDAMTRCVLTTARMTKARALYVGEAVPSGQRVSTLQRRGRMLCALQKWPRGHTSC